LYLFVVKAQKSCSYIPTYWVFVLSCSKAQGKYNFHSDSKVSLRMQQTDIQDLYMPLPMTSFEPIVTNV